MGRKRLRKKRMLKGMRERSRGRGMNYCYCVSFVTSNYVVCFSLHKLVFKQILKGLVAVVREL